MYFPRRVVAQRGLPAQSGASIFAALILAGVLATVAGAIQYVSAPSVTLTQSQVATGATGSWESTAPPPASVPATTAPADPSKICQPGYDNVLLIRGSETRNFPIPVCATQILGRSSTANITETEQRDEYTKALNILINSPQASGAWSLINIQRLKDATWGTSVGKVGIWAKDDSKRCFRRLADSAGNYQFAPVGKDTDWQCRKMVCAVTSDGKVTGIDGKNPECDRIPVQVGQKADEVRSAGTMPSAGAKSAEEIKAMALDPNTKQEDLQKEIDLFKQNGGDMSALQKAFGDSAVEVNEEIKNNQQQAADLIAQMSEEGCGQSSPKDPGLCADQKQSLEQIQKRNADLVKLNDNLIGAKISLTAETPLPPKRPGTETVAACSDPNTPGCYGPWPTQPPRTPCTGPTCPPAGGGGPPQQTGFGDIGKLLGGGMGGGQGGGQRGGGQGGGQGGGGQQQRPQQYPPQQCQQQYYCQGNTIYYRQCQQQGYSSYGGYGGGGYGGGDQPYQQCPQGYQCMGQTCQRQALWGYGTDGQPCPQPPQQPAASTCTTGTWVATSATNNTCTTGWQCKPNTTSPTAPTATLTCSTRVADVGMPVGFNFSCTNATASSASASGGAPAFSTGNALSGTATTTIQMPGDGSNRVVYTLMCTKGDVTPSQTASASCEVQTGRPSIVLVAVPQRVPSGQQATIGWVTSGQQTCTVSDPDFPEWTQQQAGNTNVNGGVTTPAITQDTTVYLKCKTVGGADKEASIKLFEI